MLKMTSDEASLAAEFGVQCGRWSQYREVDELPFGAMWCVVPPGGRTNEDTHDECELVIVADGTARFESPGRAGTLTAAHGAAVLFDSHEPHVVHNESTERPLVLLGLYWLQSASTNGAGHAA